LAVAATTRTGCNSSPGESDARPIGQSRRHTRNHLDPAAPAGSRRVESLMVATSQANRRRTNQLAASADAPVAGVRVRSTNAAADGVLPVSRRTSRRICRYIRRVADPIHRLASAPRDGASSTPIASPSLSSPHSPVRRLARRLSKTLAGCRRRSCSNMADWIIGLASRRWSLAKCCDYLGAASAVPHPPRSNRRSTCVIQKRDARLFTAF
jgi:hypothetical protein